MAKGSKPDIGGRKAFIGKKSGEMFTPEEIDKMIEEEFNPVKKELEGMSAKELLESFVEYYSMSPQTIDKCIDSFLENFNPVKTETEQPQPGIKTTAAYDNSRLEFLRMQIGPVQNFYQTLGNILFSLSVRLDITEAKVENLKAHLDQLTLERRLYKRYIEYCNENESVCSSEGFVDFIRAYAEEEQNESKKSQSI